MRMPANAGRIGRKAAIPQAVASSASVPPPWKGWNTVLPLAAMDPDFAILLDNYFPQPGYVELRRGHMEHCDTAAALPVETVMAYQAVVPLDDRLFAAAGDTIYDVTTATPSADVTGLTNARWQHVNFTTIGGKFLWCCNGADSPQHYDGTVWGTPTITGITPADIIHVNAHKNRLWFVLKNSTKAAYLDVGAIQGAATEFELGGLFTLGGYLVAMGTWTRDGGDGPDDFAAFVSSEGQIAIYQGTDPDTAATWSLVGIFSAGPPIGRRCFTKVGSDVALISIDGVLPLSQIPGMERGSAARIALTANIQPTMNKAARDWKDNFGWQLVAYPKGTRAILNVPAVEGDTQQQYVMNTVTGAWCRFLGQNANCWEVWQDRLFFGGNDGVVYEADVGGSDNGEPIEADLKLAFNYFGQRGREKRWTLCRVLMNASANITPGIALNTDFHDDAEVAAGEAVSGDEALWDVALWDTAEWPLEQTFRDEWQSVSGLGYCASLRVKVAVSAAGDSEAVLQLNGFDFLWETGSYL